MLPRQTKQVPPPAAGAVPNPGARDYPPGRWKIARLASAPHRLGFFVGMSMLSAGALWWLAVLGLRLAPGLPVPWAIGSVHVHALLMIFSYMPMFFAGFLFTAGPRWLGVPAPGARALLPTAIAWLAGWAMFLIGAHAGAPLAATGLAVVAAAWSLFVSRLIRLLRASRARDRTHLAVVTIAGVAGAGALWLAASGLAIAEPQLVRFALSAGLWWFLAPVFVAASHRMVPFFDVAVPRLERRLPNGLLWIWLTVLLPQPVLDSAAHAGNWITLAAAALDVAAALLVLQLALRWARVQNLRIRLLAMLHAGFAWFGVALGLQALTAWLAWNGQDAHEARLAALHALGMGFFGSTQLAFVTRISAGQQGRAQSIDALAWALFLGLQGAVLLRLAATALPAWQPHRDAAQLWLLLAAALSWAIVMVTWSARYMRWYGRPRSDGRPG